MPRLAARRQPSSSSNLATLPTPMFSPARKWKRVKSWKIALSRAHMHDEADIVILDEPTAAIDVDTEIKLMRAFGDMLADKIGILISHRFSTVRLASKIIVLEGGLIIEAGNHASLMNEGGEYARMFRDQASAYR